MDLFIRGAIVLPAWILCWNKQQKEFLLLWYTWPESPHIDLSFGPLWCSLTHQCGGGIIWCSLDLCWVISMLRQDQSVRLIHTDCTTLHCCQSCIIKMFFLLHRWSCFERGAAVQSFPIRHLPTYKHIVWVSYFPVCINIHKYTKAKVTWTINNQTTVYLCFRKQNSIIFYLKRLNT